MKQKRIDEMTNDIVIFAKDRINRPKDKFSNKTQDILQESEYDKNCPFCRGNEQLTPKHTYKVEDANGWITKSTLNKFPIIDTVSKDIYGLHEVMIDTYRHDGNFYNMTKDEFIELIKMYKNRYQEFVKDENIEYVSIFKNYLNRAGASLIHPHSQIISLPFIPPDIDKEVSIARDYYDKNKECMYTKLIEKEIEYKERVVYNGEKIIAIVPYATRYSGEVRIIMKEKIKFENISQKHIEEISDLLLKLFKKIEITRGKVPFNLYIHNYPKDIESLEYYNVHFHIVPRVFNLGGFELSTGIYSTSLIPEEYAQKLKVD